MASASTSVPRELAVAIIQVIARAKRGGDDETEEACDLAVDVLQRLFQVPEEEVGKEQKYSLPVVWEAGNEALAKEFEDVESNPAFDRFLSRVRDAGVFNDKEVGSPEYLEVYRVVANKFRARMAQRQAKKQAVQPPPVPEAAGAHAAPPPAARSDGAGAGAGGGMGTQTSTGADATPASGGVVADAFKEQGNEHMRGRRFADAVAMYTKAIEACPDGVSSHVYFSNRAAAHLRLNSYQSAEADARQALKLRPDYVKARVRLGTACLQQNRFAEAVSEFEQVLDDQPSNDTARQQLQTAKKKLEENSASGAANTGASAPGGGFPGGFPGGMPGGGMPGGIGGIMNNPMIQSMMSNPAIMEMAKNMMQNPTMLQSMMGALGGGGGGGGGMPDLSAMMGAMGGGMPGGGMPTVTSADSEDEEADGGMDGSGMGVMGGGGTGGGGGGFMSRLAAMRSSPEMQQYRDDPRLTQFFSDIESQGPMAAMQHMSNPAVIEMMSKIMSAADEPDDS